MAISPTADIGANLQRLGGMRGLPQEAAAEAAGLSRAAYRNLEVGLSEPRASPLVAPPKALEAAPAALLAPPPRQRPAAVPPRPPAPGTAPATCALSVKAQAQGPASYPSRRRTRARGLR